jgi:hypothetical protein
MRKQKKPQAHTPGPWAAVPREVEIGCCSGLSAYYRIVARSRRDDIGRTFASPEQHCEEQHANARLMAAAPELLQTCRQYASDCDMRISLLQDELHEAHTSEDEQRDLMDQKDGKPDFADTIDQIDHWRATKDSIQAIIAEL